MRFALLLSVCALTATSLPQAAAALPSNIVYQGVITSSGEGPQAGSLQPGEPITIIYGIDPNPVDVDPDPSRGHYLDDLAGMRITLPESGVVIGTGPGTITVWNDVSDGIGISDQVYLTTPRFAGEPALAGYFIDEVEIDFYDRVWDGSGNPDMVTSDAAPTSALLTDEMVLRITTQLGTTSFSFIAAPPTNAELIDDALARMAGFVTSGDLTKGHGTALAAKLEAIRSADSAGNDGGMCGALNSFEQQLFNLQRTGHISNAAAGELSAIAASLDTGEAGCR